MKAGILATAIVCASLGLISSAVAVETAAANNAAPVPVASANTTDPKNEMICKIEPPPLGTRIGRRKVCGTRAEWDAMSAQAQRDVRNMQVGPLANPAKGD